MGAFERGGIIVPKIGIIRGFGESEKAMGLLCGLIKALNARFRSKIEMCELPIGNYELYGTDLTGDSIAWMRSCDAVISGDIEARSNFIGYDKSDLAAALRNNIEFLYIKGLGVHSSTDIRIASYFDGGTAYRDSGSTPDGVTETRICTTYAIMNIVRFICRESEERRRKIVFVKDSENEFYSELFYKYFEDYIFPISNFYIIKMSAENISEEVLYSPNEFDTVFASKTVSDMLFGIYRFIAGADFSAYYRYEKEKSLYYVKSLCNNADFGEALPSFNCCITALSDMLEREFGMRKEAFCLRKAAALAAERGFGTDNAKEYLEEIIKELKKPMTTKFKKQKPKRVYIIK